MSLRWKIFVVLLVFISLYTVLSTLILFWVILPSFSDLEHNEAREDVGRLVEQVDREVKALEDMCFDWAAWDDTWNFVVETDPERRLAYRQANLALPPQGGYELLFIVNLEGKVIWGRAYAESDNPDARPVDVAEFPASQWPMTHPLLRIPPDTKTLSGVMMTSLGPIIVSSQAITDSLQRGEPRGTLVMGRLLNEERFAQILAQARAVGGFLALGPGALLDSRWVLLEQLTPDQPVLVKEEERILKAYTVFPGILGKPVLLMQSETPRNITARGYAAIYYALISTLMTAVIMFVIVLILLRWVVVTPLHLLTQHVMRVATEGQLKRLRIRHRKDELGLLAREFNRMVERVERDRERMLLAEEALRESQAQVLRSQHLASLGEMGASIAHEIRNPLTGISSAIQVLREKFPVGDERRALMDDVLEHAGRMEGIVQRVLMFARSWKPEKRTTDLYALSARIGADARARKEFEGVDFEIEERPSLEVQADAALIEQVLWNLVQNAVEALPQEGPRKISWRFDETADTARIILSDTGVGLSWETQQKMFIPFFTTKRNGTGLGLVVCRSIVEAHGGKITVVGSIGRGTEVVVDLPKGT